MCVCVCVYLHKIADSLSLRCVSFVTIISDETKECERYIHINYNTSSFLMLLVLMLMIQDIIVVLNHNYCHKTFSGVETILLIMP